MTTTALSTARLLVNENETAHSLWNEVCAKLLSQIGEANFRSWIAPLSFFQLDASTLSLSAPTRFIREWVENHYSDAILSLVREKFSSVLRVEIRVRKAEESVSISNNNAVPLVASGVDVSGQNVHVLAASHPKPNAPVFLDRRFRFEHFVTGPSNQIACAAAKAVSDLSRTLPGAHSLYIHGGVGQGKTHLLHAIGWQFAESNPSLRVRYLSAETFMYQFVRALQQREIFAFKDDIRNADVLLIDDIHFIAGKEGTQEEFFHTLNAFIEQGKRVVVASDRSPSEMVEMDARIRSRLSGGLVVDIEPANHELRVEILRSKCAVLGNAMISAEVIEFLASTITSNVRELEGALHKLAAHSTFLGVSVTRNHAENVLSDVLRAHQKPITVEDIVEKVAQFYKVRTQDIFSAKRLRAISRPRQIIMYLAKSLTTKSLTDIGRMLGGKDHTTVLYAVKKVEELIANDLIFGREVQAISALVNGR